MQYISNVLFVNADTGRKTQYKMQRAQTSCFTECSGKKSGAVKGVSATTPVSVFTVLTFEDKSTPTRPPYSSTKLHS